MDWLHIIALALAGLAGGIGIGMVKADYGPDRTFGVALLALAIAILTVAYQVWS